VKRPMQILILANHSGGLYDFRKDLIAELKTHASVAVAVPHNDRWDELNGLADRVIELPIDRRGMNPLHDGKLFRQYRAILGEIKPDLVLTYTIKPNIYGGLACRMAHIPYAVNITGLGSAIENGGWLKNFVLALYRPALKGARVVFFENAGNRDTLAATGVVPKGRDVVLHGAGVNLEDYPCQPYPQEGPVRFLFVGRVMHEKGVDELFAAAKRMKQQYGEQVEFHMVGSFEEAYKPVMDQLEQAGVVKYHGYQSDMKPFYAMAGCVVLPSYHEGMSNVLLEAAASGRPLITSDIPGCREAVENGVSGYLCPAKDADALYEAMRRFAALSVEQRSQMGRCGRERMEQQFSKTAVVAETIKHLEI
jgi:glycosyltransferase involved in cell wall biosynthesis